MEIEKVIQRYRSWDNDPTELLDIRRQLSLSLYELSKAISDKEVELKEATHSRKLHHAHAIINNDGSVAIKEAKATIEIDGLKRNEARLDGALRAYKIKFESVKEVLNSISSYLKEINQL